MSEEKKKTNKGEDNLISAIGYLGILCLIPILTKKDSAYAYNHGKNGLVLFIAEIGLFVIGFVPVLGWLIGFFGWLIVGVMSLVGIIKALTGSEWNMPVLGDFAKKLKI